MCLSCFLWVGASNNIGSCRCLALILSGLYVGQAYTIIDSLLSVKAGEKSACLHTDVTPVERSLPSLFASEALIYQFRVAVDAEILCCCGIS